MLSAVKALDRPTGILTDMPGRITSSAFIGRQVELESLLEVFGATLDGPAVVLLGGEAGIGKTPLVSEFAGHIPQTRVLVGACLELGQAVMPYLPLAGILPGGSGRCWYWSRRAGRTGRSAKPLH
jgi:hypothetical protein